MMEAYYRSATARVLVHNNPHCPIHGLVFGEVIESAPPCFDSSEFESGRQIADLRYADDDFLLLVRSFGCLQDRLADASSKRADVHTFKTTLESVISAHFPGLRSRVCVQLVPCPPVVSDTLNTLDT
ncbi:unnamed protein product [Dibothriocephalus latus]|uniref:Uncharacterized protein n=1 Tax=Dibothriocephalus latus TaxID=60516 RepID=A0A3P7M4Z7_DIBLA|nr:unnamed protein product [Dibothriocephalus latus]